jgi:hypothetical protein
MPVFPENGGHALIYLVAGVIIYRIAYGIDGDNLDILTIFEGH